MINQISWKIMCPVSLAVFLVSFFASAFPVASEIHRASPGNFGLPGVIDLPTAKRFPDGELVVTHQNHKYLFMTGLSFQALPQLGLSFRYGGHGLGGSFAQGRINWDRSFDAHIFLTDEGKYSPAISLGLRDFIGTGRYSSEYLVGTKSFGKFEFTSGLGFGRLAGRNSFKNPLGTLSKKFDDRGSNNLGQGGTLGTINWFQGNVAAFYGMQYFINEKASISVEYTPDFMSSESTYMDINSPWNFATSYRLNDYISFSAQYLHGSQISFTGHLSVNPDRPPLLGGKELAPVPMRLRSDNVQPIKINDEKVIRKVLTVDGFEIFDLEFNSDTVKIVINNTKFRSTAQAVGRIASTLQRFTSDDIKFAIISFNSLNLQLATYQVNLEKITGEQFDPTLVKDKKPSIIAIDTEAFTIKQKREKRFEWGIGPYITHRLFNPDLPLSMETGIEIQTGYQFGYGFKIASTIRKSLLTNLTDNNRRSNSVLPRVHSDWPLYDFAGQNGHIHSLAVSYVKNIAPGLYGRAHAGLLEPFFAGFGGEILYKPANRPLGIGLDVHHVRKRDYDMKFDLLNYRTTVGHVSLYYDAGKIFDIEINAGRYLAGDWGATATISREFGSGWQVGGYATLTDVPFDTFGEGSFDKAIFVSIPLDWITSSPTQAQRKLTLRPITRDGGANLASARSLNQYTKRSHNAAFQREFGRLWK